MADVHQLFDKKIDEPLRIFANFENENGDSAMENRITRLEVEFEHVRKDLDEIKSDLKEFRKEVREESKASRRTTVITGISIMIGMAGVLFVLWQMQQAWIQGYLEILTKVTHGG